MFLQHHEIPSSASIVAVFLLSWMCVCFLPSLYLLLLLSRRGRFTAHWRHDVKRRRKVLVRGSS